MKTFRRINVDKHLDYSIDSCNRSRSFGFNALFLLLYVNYFCVIVCVDYLSHLDINMRLEKSVGVKV